MIHISQGFHLDEAARRGMMNVLAVAELGNARLASVSERQAALTILMAVRTARMARVVRVVRHARDVLSVAQAVRSAGAGSIE
jgi:hypothetical protein